jgi:hypothetical protein
VRSKDEILEWEGRWLLPAGLATFAAIALLVVGALVSAAVHGDGEAEILRSVQDNSSALRLGSLLQAVGFALLIPSLVVLFRAAQARSDRVRGQLIGLVVAAPLFFAAATGLNAFASTEAADQFTAGDVKPTLTKQEAATDCRSERQDNGAEEFGEEFEGGRSPTRTCESEKLENSEASEAISGASLAGLASGFGIGGRFGLAIALLYIGLWGMRTGLLTRFWGSLGMALGVATLLGLVLFLVIWFVYVGLLLLGRLPGGRPPAWGAGEAIPWPTPGDRAAESLEPANPDDPPSPPPADGTDPSSERRKRKQRD